jgi:transcriptional regulator with XRE-family HTH domain
MGAPWKIVKAEWFAGRLRELRETSGLTQAELGRLAGFTREGIAQLETGRRSPAWGTVVALLNALQVDCAAFLTPPRPREPPGPGRPAAQPADAATRPKRARGQTQEPRADNTEGGPTRK